MASEELELLWPADLVCSCQGFAIDMGASVIKVAVRPKRLYKDGKKISPEATQSNMAPICGRLFPLSAIDDVIEYIQTEADYKENVTTLHTGINLTRYQQKIETKLKTKIELLPEIKIFCESLIYSCKHFKEADLFEMPPEAAVSAGRSQGSLREMALRFMGSIPRQVAFRQDLAVNADWPCMLIMCGSGFLHMKLYEDGQFEVRDIAVLCGRTFLGMASILSGTQNFDEILSMAEKSDGGTVDLKTKDMVDPEADPETDPYRKVPPEEVIFQFGKTWKNPQDATPGDLSHSTLTVFSRELAHCSHLLARDAGVRRLYFCGHFVSSHFVQDIITQEIALKDSQTPEENRLDFRFVKNSGHFGTLGCLLRSWKQEMT